ncbi:uncharacterized protein IL334_005905 [Kwoniella shivajii]|uniref:Uncharacterized protein n=1 Tax=Kwoniella shivajii TaxID=564305 RepID=A0ABZ1D539_9TREE|nr:hypothetical protein IL334_005905 [Kwoniella shivajii]
MINPTAWNWGNYAGLFWAGSCFLVSSMFTSECQSLRAGLSLRTAQVNAFDHALHHQAGEDKPEEHMDHVERA